MDSTRLHAGMTVTSSGGEKLGKVSRCDRQTFIIEKGTILKKQYVARYEDVAEISGEEVRLACGEEALGRLERGAPAGGALGEAASPLGASGGVATVPTGPLQTEPEVRPDPGAQGEREQPGRRREEDEARQGTITYGMGEDPGSLSARRDDSDTEEP